MIDDKRNSVQIKGSTATFLVFFILLGSFGGMLYLISLVV